MVAPITGAVKAGGFLGGGVSQNAGIGGLLIENTLGKALEGFVGSTIEGASILAKYEVFDSLGVVSNWCAEFLDLITNHPDLQANELSGITPTGMVNILRGAIEATLRFGIIMDSEISEELFMELIQEGFSNAIQNTIGGALQTIAGVYRGSYPLNPNEIDNLVLVHEFMDRKTLAFLMASAGASLPSTIYRVISGFQQKTQQDLALMRQQAVAFQDQHFTRALSFHSAVADFIEDGLRNAMKLLITQAEVKVSIMSEQAERALARLFELDTEVNTAVAEKDAGLVTQAEVDTVKLQNQLELLAMEAQYDALKTEFDTQIALLDDVDWINWKADWASGESAVISQLNVAKAQVGAIDTAVFLQPLLDAYDDILAYRNANSSVTTSSSTTPLVLTPPFGVGTTPPPTQPPNPNDPTLVQWTVNVHNSNGVIDIPNVLVQIVGSLGYTASLLTNVNGDAIFANVPRDLYQVTLSRVGYQTRIISELVNPVGSSVTNGYYLLEGTGGEFVYAVSEMDIRINLSETKLSLKKMEAIPTIQTQDRQVTATQTTTVSIA